MEVTKRTATIYHISSYSDLTDNKKDGLAVISDERAILEITAFNCTKTEFIAWFLESERGSTFASDGVCLYALGSVTNFSEGQRLTVNYSEYMEGMLNRKCDKIKAELEQLTNSFQKHISEQ